MIRFLDWKLFLKKQKIADLQESFVQGKEGELIMKRAIIILSVALVIIISVCTAFLIKDLNKEEIEEKADTKVSELTNEPVTDECVDEANNFEEIEIEETNSNEEKTSPNCKLTMKRYYNECGHSIEEYTDLNNELVNKTKDEIQQVYSAWTIDKFSNDEIIISRSFDSQCGEHYIVRDKDGKVAVYLLSGDGTETELQETEISTEFLTEADKLELQNGISANGRQELNQVIENFE